MVMPKDKFPSSDGQWSSFLILKTWVLSVLCVSECALLQPTHLLYVTATCASAFSPAAVQLLSNTLKWVTCFIITSSYHFPYWMCRFTTLWNDIIILLLFHCSKIKLYWWMLLTCSDDKTGGISISFRYLNWRWIYSCCWIQIWL